jgi:hypothetical protein
MGVEHRLVAAEALQHRGGDGAIAVHRRRDEETMAADAAGRRGELGLAGRDVGARDEITACVEQVGDERIGECGPFFRRNGQR